MTLPNVRPRGRRVSGTVIQQRLFLVTVAPVSLPVCLELDDFFQGSDGSLNDNDRSKSINLVALTPRD